MLFCTASKYDLLCDVSDNSGIFMNMTCEDDILVSTMYVRVEIEEIMITVFVSLAGMLLLR
jgi:hypothetical protein